ncbi:hypothetical protein D9757_009079 [Collybiopsis confluens]|uniref:Protein HGH1 homolog n=1 Tax=Collybiopsis confluens TaxID=2823264 RepID=A0A8H5HD91_9AGAR|nr:hypothetical protein D9757_009079 [Collybiopsis confluens]
MQNQLRELLPFLRDKNPQVRQIALSNLISQTVPEAQHRNIFSETVIRDLKVLCRDQLVSIILSDPVFSIRFLTSLEAVAHDAFKALVNLSESPSIVASLSDVPFLTFLVAYIINPQSIVADLSAMLLSNLSASATACSVLISLKIKIITSSNVPNGFLTTQARSGSSPDPVPYPPGNEIEVLALPLLLDAFVQGANVEEVKDLKKRPRKASLHFLAGVFANLASSSGGRDFFSTPRPTNSMKPDSELEFPIAKIVSFTEHRDVVRRRGVVSTIKNFCFNARAHRALLTPADERTRVPVPRASLASTTAQPVAAPGIDALPFLLLPLAGPEELDIDSQDLLPPALQFLPPTKTREVDPSIRLTIVEILLLCCHTRWGRDYMRGKAVYEVIKASHEVEREEKVREGIERWVQLIKGQEPSMVREVNEEDEEEEEFDRLPENDLPPEVGLIQGLGAMSINGTGTGTGTGIRIGVGGNKREEQEEEEEFEIQPLGGEAEEQKSKHTLENEDDDDDDKIVEV